MCVILHMMSVITQFDWSALIMAASGDHTGVVVELVKAKANLDLQDEVCDGNAIPCIYCYSAHDHVHVLVNVTQSITFFVDFSNWLS